MFVSAGLAACSGTEVLVGEQKETAAEKDGGERESPSGVSGL